MSFDGLGAPEVGTFDLKFNKVNLPKCNIHPDKRLFGANLYRGLCPVGCIYCYARSLRPNVMHTKSPKVASVSSIRKLGRGRWPEFLFLSSSSEPFQPRTQELARELSCMAFERGTFVSFSTKLRPSDDMIDLLERNRDKTCVSLSLSSVEPERNNVLEPGAPPAEARLAFAGELVRRKVPIWIKADTLFASMDDGDASFGRLVHSASEAGVKRILISYAFYRKNSKKRIEVALNQLGYSLEEMSEEQPIASGRGYSIPLDEKAIRLRRLGEAARSAGFERIITCGCKNDIAPESIGFDSRVCEFHWN
jgi:DNA repair photolyase